MHKLSLASLWLMLPLLAGCTSSPDSPSAQRDEFHTVHQRCRDFSETKQRVVVAAGGIGSQHLSVPNGMNRAAYAYCMERAGYPLIQPASPLGRSTPATGS